MLSHRSEECFIASAVPNRAMLDWCQTVWWAFAQTVTPLPLSAADGASHSYCVEGYVTALWTHNCVLNLIWTTPAGTRYAQNKCFMQCQISLKATKTNK